MAAYLEFHIKGGGCALVEAGMIGAVIARGHDVWKVGTSETPTVVILRAGETLEVIGVSPGGVIARAVTAREQARKAKYQDGTEVWVDWLTPMEQRDDADGEPRTGV